MYMKSIAPWTGLHLLVPTRTPEDWDKSGSTLPPALMTPEASYESAAAFDERRHKKQGTKIRQY